MKNEIAEAMIRLLDDHPYSEITVTMICGSVPVSRTAFYRYFHDKEDVLFYFVSLEYLEKCFPIFRFHLKEKGTVCFFSYILESKERYMKLYEIDQGIFLFRALKAAYRIGFERRREYSMPVSAKNRFFDPEVFLNTPLPASLRLLFAGSGKACGFRRGRLPEIFISCSRNLLTLSVIITPEAPLLFCFLFSLSIIVTYVIMRTAGRKDLLFTTPPPYRS